MASNGREYREELYRLRSHPRSKRPDDFADRRDSLAHLYFSLFPFLALEYFIERNFETVSGLIFPMGYLLFWSFYYTYYRPGFLEEKLRAPEKTQWGLLPALILGVAIWFVKVSIVELNHILLLHWLRAKTKPAPKAPAKPAARSEDPRMARARRAEHQRRASEKHASKAQTPPKAPPAPSLPSDVVRALNTLGLGECRDWNEIHHRYRELAKKYHPDLNPEITHSRFIQFDAAYRKLSTVKTQYFHDRKVAR